MRFLKIESLCDKIQQSRATVYNKLNAKSPYYDPSFPKPRHLGKRCVRWLEDEVHSWMKRPGAMTDGGGPCARV